MEVHPAPSAQPDAATSGPRKARLMAEVNSRLRQLAGTLAHSDPIAFFCECSRPDCYAVVWMSSVSFDATATGRAGWLTAEGHEPCELSEPRERRAAPNVLAPRQPRQPAAESGRPPGRRLHTVLRERLARSA